MDRSWPSDGPGVPLLPSLPPPASFCYVRSISACRRARMHMPCMPAQKPAGNGLFDACSTNGVLRNQSLSLSSSSPCPLAKARALLPAFSPSLRLAACRTHIELPLELPHHLLVAFQNRMDLLGPPRLWARATRRHRRCGLQHCGSAAR